MEQISERFQTYDASDVAHILILKNLLILKTAKLLAYKIINELCFFLSKMKESLFKINY